MTFNPKDWSLSEKMFSDPETFKHLTQIMIPGVDFHNGPMDKYTQSNTYIGNSTGHRGPEIAGAKILVNGCSQTFGVGVEEEQTWPAILSKLTGLSYANIALPGNSIQAIVQSTVAYVRDYGSPDYICLNLPDLFRAYLPARSDVLIYNKAYINDDVISMGLGTTALTQRDRTWPLFSKRPYVAEDVLPLEVPLFLSMMSINYIVEFCRVASIPLYLTTWHESTAQLLGHIKAQSEIDPNFSKLDLRGFSRMTIINPIVCHAEPADTPYWQVASDLTHMGAHDHLHFAELFADKIKNHKKLANK